MRETRHEETKTRSPGTGTSTWIPGRDNRKIERNVSLPDLEPKALLARRLARSHGGQGTNCLTVSLKKKPPQSGGFAFFKHRCLSECRRILEQTDFQIVCGVDQTIVNQHFTIRQAHNQTTVNNAFEVNTVSDFLRSRQDWPVNFTSPTPSARPLPSPPSQPR